MQLYHLTSNYCAQTINKESIYPDKSFVMMFYLPLLVDFLSLFISPLFVTTKIMYFYHSLLVKTSFVSFGNRLDYTLCHLERSARSYANVLQIPRSYFWKVLFTYSPRSSNSFARSYKRNFVQNNKKCHLKQWKSVYNIIIISWNTLQSKSGGDAAPSSIIWLIRDRVTATNTSRGYIATG